MVFTQNNKIYTILYCLAGCNKLVYVIHADTWFVISCPLFPGTESVIFQL